MNVQKIINTALVLGASARLTRFIVTDDLGEWWVKEPLRSLAARHDDKWDKYVEGTECPYCVSFWATAAVMGAGAVLRWNKVWQWGAGVWAASYVVSHVSSRLDDD